MTYKPKIMNDKIHKYQMDGYVANTTTYTNTYPEIDLTHWKCVCCRCKDTPTFYFTKEYTSLYIIIPYIKYHVHRTELYAI